MNAIHFPKDIEARILDVDNKLRPIANLPIDITQPGWNVRVAQLPHPLDRAGVRHEANSLLEELIDSYDTGGHEVRATIRQWFNQYRAFAWAANLSFDPTTVENFRKHLALFSMKDQGSDSRDALLWLQHLCRTATAAGVNTGPSLKAAAELSNDLNKYGMGSTRQMLLCAIPPRE